MNRSHGLQRHKPLTRTPIRVTAEQVQAYRDQQRAKRIERALQASTSRPKDTGPSRKVRDLIRDERAKKRCEVTGLWLGDTDGQLHHRRPRQAGGTKRPDTNTPPNLLLLHPDMHAWIESNRTEAYEFGLLLHDRQIPADESVQLLIGRVYLTHFGTYSTARSAA